MRAPRLGVTGWLKIWWKQQPGGVLAHLDVARSGLLAVVFWTMVILAGGRAMHTGHGPTAAVVVALWLVVLVPILLLQIGSIFDFVSYFFLHGNARVYSGVRRARQARTGIDLNAGLIEALGPLSPRVDSALVRPTNATGWSDILGRTLTAFMIDSSPISSWSNWANASLFSALSSSPGSDPGETSKRSGSPESVAGSESTQGEATGSLSKPHEPLEFYERKAKLTGAYIAFVAALLVAVAAKSSDFPEAGILIALLGLSLPSLCAYAMLDHMVVAQQRDKSATRGLAGLLGFVPSLLAVVVVIAQFSVLTAILFVVLVLFWAHALVNVAVAGRHDPRSTI